MRCLSYAMGGGRGHQTRARNLHRALKRLQPDLTTHLLVPEDRVRQDESDLTVLTAPSKERQALSQWITEVVERLSPELILIDTFPRGVLGELASLGRQTPTALVTRWVAPDYYRHPPVREALNRFDAVFWTEPKSDPTFPGERTDPVVDERPVMPRDQARQLLGCDGRPLVLALPWRHGEAWLANAQALQEICRRRGWNLRIADPELSQEFSRADQLLSGADLILAASGYNTYYEIAKHHRPAVWLPQPRKTDSQHLRAFGRFAFSCQARQELSFQDPSEEQMERLLSGTRPLEGSPPRPQGGAQIAQRLQQLVGSAR